VYIEGCFGWFHPAAGTRGVVLCPPHGYEEVCVHRVLSGLAGRFAAAGLPTLRLDYHGTGDSAGDDEQPDRVAAWLGSVRAAVEWMRASAGVQEVALVGLRLGGTLAAVVAAELGDVHSLALLAAPPTGKGYARELKALAMLQPPVDGGPPAPERGGDLEAAGFVLRIREPEWEQHRLLTDRELTVNLHVFSSGSPELRRHVLFRDWLRTHDDDRAAYGALKIELGRHGFRDGMDYNNHKAALVYDIYERIFLADPVHGHDPQVRAPGR